MFLANGLATATAGKSSLRATFTRGGALAFRAAKLQLSDALVAGNMADEAGAMHCRESQVDASRVVFSNNTALRSGGHIMLQFADVTTFANVALLQGRALDGVGGAVYVEEILKKNSWIQGRWANNSASKSGGAIHAAISDTVRKPVVLSGVRVEGNTAGTSGGGLFADKFVDVFQLHNTTITGNRAMQSTAAGDRGTRLFSASISVSLGRRVQASGSSAFIGADMHGAVAVGYQASQAGNATLIGSVLVTLLDAYRHPMTIQGLDATVRLEAYRLSRLSTCGLGASSSINLSNLDWQSTERVDIIGGATQSVSNGTAVFNNLQVLIPPGHVALVQAYVTSGLITFNTSRSFALGATTIESLSLPYIPTETYERFVQEVVTTGELVSGSVLLLKSACCPAGTYRGPLSCVDCGPGRIQQTSDHSLPTCDVCPAGWTQGMNRAVECQRCAPGKFSTAMGSSGPCQDCDEGTYTLTATSTRCELCPDDVAVETCFGNTIQMQTCTLYTPHTTYHTPHITPHHTSNITQRSTPTHTTTVKQ